LLASVTSIVVCAIVVTADASVVLASELDRISMCSHLAQSYIGSPAPKVSGLDAESPLDADVKVPNTLLDGSVVAFDVVPCDAVIE